MDPTKSIATFNRLVRKKLVEAQIEEEELSEDSEKSGNTTHNEQILNEIPEAIFAGVDGDDAFVDEIAARSSHSPSNGDEVNAFVGALRINITDDSEHCYSTSSENEIPPFEDDSSDDSSVPDCGSASSVGNVADFEREMEDTLNNKIARIAIKHRLTHSSVNDILRLFRDIGHDVNLDARTILRTPQEACDESFEHFGLIRGIAKKIRNGVSSDTHQLKLQISIDGIPLYHSSTIQFWPILGRILNCTDCRPFVISVYCGPTKPPDLHAFLSPFLEEIKMLENNSLTVDGRSYCVVLKNVICDTPARSFIKMIKPHTGLYGCERCDQRGEKNFGMTFPSMNSTLRDNSSFRRQASKPHHQGKSPFTKILSLDMINGFPLDYMHLVCLGVMKKLLLLWRGEKNTAVSELSRRQQVRKKDSKKAMDRVHRLSQEQLGIINRRIVETSKQFPSEFHRKGRPLDVLEHWKAVEFRTFLLYSGPVVLKHVLDDENYEHFLYLHAAIRILCSPSLSNEQINYADHCLKYFVNKFGIIYGTYQLSYNVHNLIHLANECIFQHGPLDSFSAFPFESYLGQLKSLLRGTRRPLAQLKRRLCEIDYHESAKDPIITNESSFSLNALKSNSNNDSFLMIDRSEVLYVTAISNLNVTGILLPLNVHNRRYTNFFDEPLEASNLHIYMSDVDFRDYNEQPTTLPLSNCKNLVKCVSIMTSNDEFDDAEEVKMVLFPLLHNL